MTKEELLNKRTASYVVDYADGNRIQKDCLIDMKTGDIDVGADKIVGKKYDASRALSSHVEFRGREFAVESADLNNKKDQKKILDLDGFSFQDRQPVSKTIQEIQDERRKGWKPR